MRAFILDRSPSNGPDVELIVIYDKLWFEKTTKLHIPVGERPFKYFITYIYSAITRNLKFQLCSLAAEKPFQI